MEGAKIQIHTRFRFAMIIMQENQNLFPWFQSFSFCKTLNKKILDQKFTWSFQVKWYFRSGNFCSLLLQDFLGISKVLLYMKRKKKGSCDRYINERCSILNVKKRKENEHRIICQFNPTLPLYLLPFTRMRKKKTLCKCVCLYVPFFL